MSTNTDPFAWMNYGAEQIGAARLPAATNGAGITVAVIDTGVDAQHAELTGKVEQIDVSGFGTSADRHGTAIAGIIAAEPNNGVGAFGIAPGVKILSIKACEPGSRKGLEARCWSSTIAKALDRALRADAPIINMSLGGPPDPLVQRLIDKAAEQGRLVIAAAGNDGANANPPFPAAHPAVMAVTAVDARDKLYTRAVQGPFVDIAAPGVEVPVPVPGESYPAQLTGTSMATAYAAGAAALLLSMDPARGAADVRSSLESGTVDLGPEARDESYGRGRIDLCGAVGLHSDSDVNHCK
jgi:subtilisin family serine protease